MPMFKHLPVAMTREQLINKSVKCGREWLLSYAGGLATSFDINETSMQIINKIMKRQQVLYLTVDRK